MKFGRKILSLMDRINSHRVDLIVTVWFQENTIKGDG